MTNNESNEESSKEKTELITKERIENGYEPASLIVEDNTLDNNVDLKDIENK